MYCLLLSIQARANDRIQSVRADESRAVNDLSTLQPDRNAAGAFLEAGDAAVCPDAVLGRLSDQCIEQVGAMDQIHMVPERL